jgi:hypothetical protein
MTKKTESKEPQDIGDVLELVRQYGESLGLKDVQVGCINDGVFQLRLGHYVGGKLVKLLIPILVETGKEKDGQPEKALLFDFATKDAHTAGNKIKILQVAKTFLDAEVGRSLVRTK